MEECGCPYTHQQRRVAVRCRCGNTTGDMASYDTFTLGGPNSLRGFNVGEVAACRRFVEAAVELRYPVFGRQLFAFYEHANDLGESGRHHIRLLHLILTY